jgi:hypothetical protein
MATGALSQMVVVDDENVECCWATLLMLLCTEP